MASPVDCCQRLPVSTSRCTSLALTMLSYSKCRRRPLSSARKTAPVPHVLHQVYRHVRLGRRSTSHADYEVVVLRERDVGRGTEHGIMNGGVGHHRRRL